MDAAAIGASSTKRSQSSMNSTPRMLTALPQKAQKAQTFSLVLFHASL
jgi:hypothetical protein